MIDKCGLKRLCKKSNYKGKLIRTGAVKRRGKLSSLIVAML